MKAVIGLRLVLRVLQSVTRKQNILAELTTPGPANTALVKATCPNFNFRSSGEMYSFQVRTDQSHTP